MKYVYRALLNGQYSKGRVDASTEKEVVDYLRAGGLFPVDIHQDRSLTSSFLSQFIGRVSTDDVINFTRQFAIMLNAGLTISGSLDILIQQASKETFHDMLTEISNSIKAGDSFSKSLSIHPRQFPRLYISLIKAGEASGKLNEIMAKMADDMEKQREFAGRIKGMMVYPIIIILGVIGVIIILLTVVVPQLSGLYKDMGVELPIQTQIVITGSEFLLQYKFLLIIVSIAAFTGIKKLVSIEKNKILIQSTLMRIPKVGEVLVMSTLVGATRTLSLLIQSGVLMLEGLNIITNSTENIIFQRAFRNVYKSVQNGKTLSESFEKEDVFPPILIEMIAVGERTGKLDEVLRKISAYFEMQSDMAIKAATTVIEPLTLVILGGVVLAVVMAVITPIYNLTSQMGQ
jgi:type IV pilus assembly protein PilC